MTRRHLTLRAFVAAMMAATLVASAASAMPAKNAGWPAARHATTMHHSVPSPARIDAAAHAATIRAIGASLAGHARA